MIKNRISVLKSYKAYKNKYPKDHSLFLRYSEFSTIAKSFGSLISYELITTGTEITLPSKLGTLQIVKYMPSRKLVDYMNTAKVYGEHNKNNPDDKKVVYHMNRITKGYMPKLYWSKALKARFKNQSKFLFKFNRPNVRPNSYNKNNPKVSLMPFFREEGFRIYEIFNPTIKRELHEQLLKKHKNRTS